MVGAGGLVDDALDRSSDPIDQRPEAGRVIVELGGMAVGQPVRVQVRMSMPTVCCFIFPVSWDGP